MISVNLKGSLHVLQSAGKIRRLQELLPGPHRFHRSADRETGKTWCSSGSSHQPRLRASLGEHELLAVVLGKGYSQANMSASDRWQRARLRSPRRAPLDLARWILEQANGLGSLVRTIQTSNLGRFRLGPILGSRLLATAQLSMRFYLDPELDGDARIRDLGKLDKRLLADPSELTEGELLAVALSDSWPSIEEAGELLGRYGGLSQLIRNVSGPDLEDAYPRRIAALAVAFSEVATRFQAGAVDVSTRVAVELSLAMLGLGGHILQAMVRKPQPELLSQCAELMRRAQQIGSELVAGERLSIPDLEAIHVAMEGIGRDLGGRPQPDAR